MAQRLKYIVMILDVQMELAVATSDIPKHINSSGPDNR